VDECQPLVRPRPEGHHQRDEHQYQRLRDVPSFSKPPVRIHLVPELRVVKLFLHADVVAAEQGLVNIARRVNDTRSEPSLLDLERPSSPSSSPSLLLLPSSSSPSSSPSSPSSYDVVSNIWQAPTEEHIAALLLFVGGRIGVYHRRRASRDAGIGMAAPVAAAAIFAVGAGGHLCHAVFI